MHGDEKMHGYQQSYPHKRIKMWITLCISSDFMSYGAAVSSYAEKSQNMTHTQKPPIFDTFCRIKCAFWHGHSVISGKTTA